MDRRRGALSGEEIRGCWEAIAGDNRPPDATPWASRIIDPSQGGRRSRVEFVPVEELRAGGPIAGGGTGGEGATFRYQLWDDLEA